MILYILIAYVAVVLLLIALVRHGSQYDAPQTYNEGNDFPRQMYMED